MKPTVSHVTLQLLSGNAQHNGHIAHKVRREAAIILYFYSCHAACRRGDVGEFLSYATQG